MCRLAGASCANPAVLSQIARASRQFCDASASTSQQVQPPAETRVAEDPRVLQLADSILELNLLQVSDLTDLLRKRLNIQGPPLGAWGLAAGQAARPAEPSAAAAVPDAGSAAKKDSFDIKLEGFDAASKIKVIKEIRSITELGLKEAKDLVRAQRTRWCARPHWRQVATVCQ